MTDWQGKHNPEGHHVGIARAWSLTCSQWCYESDWCEDCKRAEYGDPWEIIERQRAEIERLRAGEK